MFLASINSLIYEAASLIGLVADGAMVIFFEGSIVGLDGISLTGA